PTIASSVASPDATSANAARSASPIMLCQTYNHRQWQTIAAGISGPNRHVHSYRVRGGVAGGRRLAARARTRPAASARRAGALEFAARRRARLRALLSLRLGADRRRRADARRAAGGHGSRARRTPDGPRPPRA